MAWAGSQKLQVRKEGIGEGWLGGGRRRRARDLVGGVGEEVGEDFVASEGTGRGIGDSPGGDNKSGKDWRGIVARMLDVRGGMYDFEMDGCGMMVLWLRIGLR